MTVNVDPHVYQLAEDFIEDSAVALNPTNVESLAIDIQSVIEDWFSFHEPKPEATK